MESLEDRFNPNAYLVNVLGDASGSNGGTGAGLQGDLRFAIASAIADDQADTITFDESVFSSAQTILLNTELTTSPGTAVRYGPTAFVVSGTANITITGPSAGVAIDGRDSVRLFAVTSNASLTLRNLTFQNGSSAGTAGGLRAGGGAGLGGAVFNDGGNLTVSGSTFANNSATGGNGGPGSDPTGNAGNGGGLGGSGATGTFGSGGGKGAAGGLGGGGGGARFNFAGGPGGFGGGGGANGSGSGAAGAAGGYAGGAGSSDNQLTGPGGGGGGLGGAIFNNQGTLTLTNDTFTGNTAAGGTGFVNGIGQGGAVFTRNGTVTATFVTLSLNTSAGGGTDLFGLIDSTNGGNNTSPGTAFLTLTLTDSILGQSGTTTVSDLVIAVSGIGNSNITGSNNLISNTLVGGFFTSPASGTDPNLGALASNGGPTQTMALLADSPALGAGFAINGITTDQRGTSQNTPPDIGAYSEFAPGVITVSPNSLTLTTTIYGQASAASTYTISGILLTNDVTVQAPAGVEVSADGGTTYHSSLTLTPTGGILADTTIFVRFTNTLGAGNFSGTITDTSVGAVQQDVAVTGTVNKAHLTVTANDASRLYGDADPAFTSTITGYVNGENSTAISGSASFSTPGSDNATSPAGSTYAISVTQGTLAAANYDFTPFVAGTLTVSKAHLTVTANDASRTYGSGDPGFTPTITGFVNGDKSSVVSGAASFSTPGSDNAASPAGSTYTISVTQGTLAAANYDFTTFNSGTLSVTVAHLTVTANNASRRYGRSDPEFSSTITGFVNGENESDISGFAEFSTPGSDNASSPAGSTYVITATQGTLAAANYDFTPFIAGTLTVTTAPLTITADDNTKAYGAAVPTLTASYSGFENGETPADLTTLPTLTTTATAGSSVAGSPYAITASGAVGSNYTISYVAGALTVTPVALFIVVDNQLKVYGAALPVLTASYEGFANGDTPASLSTPPVISTTATAASSVAGSPYAITASGAVDSNYIISYDSGRLTITAAPLTITADNRSKVLNAPLPPLTASYSGFVNGDTASSLNTPPALSTTATESSPVSGNPYPITASGAEDANYAISYVQGILTVTNIVPLLVVGAGPGGDPEVKAYDPITGVLKFDFMAYDIRFSGGVRVASGDVNGDGVADIITGAGPGGAPHVKVFSGVDGSLLASFYAYDSSFRGGVHVAAGDVDSDGIDNIITGAGDSGAPHVKVFSSTSGATLLSFFAYDSSFRGGVNVGSGDADGDGVADIITGAGPGGGPNVRAFNGTDGALLLSFFAFDAAYTGGVSVASRTVPGLEHDQIIAGQGVGGSLVRLFDGKTGTQLSSFSAYAPDFTGGVTVASADVDGDEVIDIVTGSGPGGGPHVKTFRNAGGPAVDSFYAFDLGFGGGIFVG